MGRDRVSIFGGFQDLYSFKFKRGLSDRYIFKISTYFNEFCDVTSFAETCRAEIQHFEAGYLKQQLQGQKLIKEHVVHINIMFLIHDLPKQH